MKRMLLGNDAIALGAFMAGVTVATGYPGTPSTEILERFAEYPGVYAEWSPNEKVAMEVGMGAAMAGARTMVTMKHVGLNVAADPFFAVAYTGTEAGLVVISADDPGMHSSQGEQDNRNYAKFAKVPLLEPSDSQECADMMRLGLEISEQFDTPVLLRTTTRVSHAQSLVEVAAEQIQRGSVRRPATAEGGSVGRPATAEGGSVGRPATAKGGSVGRPATAERRPATAELLAFKRDPAKYVMLPANARQRRLVMEERLAKLQDYVETTPLNFIRWGDRSLGIVTSSIAYVYAREVFPNASFLKLGMAYPLPRKLILEFARQVDTLLICEELDPFLEEQIRALPELPVARSETGHSAGAVVARSETDHSIGAVVARSETGHSTGAMVARSETGHSAGAVVARSETDHSIGAVMARSETGHSAGAVVARSETGHSAGALPELPVARSETDHNMQAARERTVRVRGKDVFPSIGEFTPELLARCAVEHGIVPAEAIPAYLLAEPETQPEPAPRPGSGQAVAIPQRPPLLCPGCGHRGTFYVLRQLMFGGQESGDREQGSGVRSQESGVRGQGTEARSPYLRVNLERRRQYNLVVTGDIGCYTLGALQPLYAMDTCACMGASIGHAIGLEKAGIKNKIVAVIGDSTFFHSGITGLVDVVTSGAATTVIILDNFTTAMTGGNVNPGTGKAVDGKPARRVELETLCRGLGIADVVVISGFDTAAIERELFRALQSDEPSVLIVREPCVLEFKSSSSQTSWVEPEKCVSCWACLVTACPALIRKDGKVAITPERCTDCQVCNRICPYDAILRVERDSLMRGG